MTDLENQKDASEQPVETTARPSDDTLYTTTFGSADAGNEDTTWEEVFKMCCSHSPLAWAAILFKLFWAGFFLYFFIFGLNILSGGAQVLTGCAAGALFGDDVNPISGLVIGIICTVCLQSSSTTTSIIVTLVGAGAVSVNQGIYMVMGSNIGTSVTNTIVAIGQMGDADQLERAFAGATVHDAFNILTVSIMFPLELITGFLEHLTEFLISNASTSKGSKNSNFFRRIIAPPAEAFIIVNKKVTQSVAQGGSCDDFYPSVCEDPENPTRNSCSTIGLIGCPKDGDAPCPVLFESGASYNDDLVAGLVSFFLGIMILFLSLYGLMTVLDKLLLGVSERVVYKATNINGYLAMLIGALVTMVVQSSSIFTSTLTPIAGMGLLRLEQMLPLTLGANIGTCMTSLLAAFVTEGTDALQVALAHLFFNITGILIWYPFPLMRRAPIYLARQLGKATRLWKGFPVIYIISVFIVTPLILLALSSLFGRNQTLMVIGSVAVAVIVVAIAGWMYWLYWRGGLQTLGAYLKRRQQNANALETLPYDVHYVQRRIMELQKHSTLIIARNGEAEPREYSLALVSEEMNYALEMVETLAKHTGLKAEEDIQNLGRFWHKETESMTDINISERRGYEERVFLILGLIVLGLSTNGLLILFEHGSTGYTAMGILISVVLFLLVVNQFRSYIRDYKQDGKVYGSYKNKKLRKMFMKNYASTMTQIKFDLEKLATHTLLEVSESEETPSDIVSETTPE